MGNISLETEIPVEGEHISRTVYTEEHICRAWPGMCAGKHITGEHICATPVRCRSAVSSMMSQVAMGTGTSQSRSSRPFGAGFRWA